VQTDYLTDTIFAIRHSSKVTINIVNVIALLKMPTHRKSSITARIEAPKVYCDICNQNIPNTKNINPGRFLRSHQGQCRRLLTERQSIDSNIEPKKQRSIPIDQYVDSFRTTFGHSDSFYEGLDDYDEEDAEVGGVHEARLQLTAEECGLLVQDACTVTAHGSACDIVYSLIQRNKYGDKLLGFDINKLRPSNAMEVIQLRLLRLMMEEEADTELMKFRNMGNKTVDWTDLIQLFDFGLSVGLSDASGNRLLAVINEILGKHGSNILLRKSWRHIRMAIDKQKTRKMQWTIDIRVPLPPTFGEANYFTKRPLRAFHGTAEDIRVVLAEMLLSIDPSKLVLEYQPTMNGEEVAHPNEQLLGEFTTGKLFQQFSVDAKKYGDVAGMRVVPLCFGIWADETTTSASRNMSELPVYISLLNAGTQLLAYCFVQICI